MSDAEIERIGRGLLDCSLPKIEWTHAAHFAAAFWLLRRSEAPATRDMPGIAEVRVRSFGLAAYLLLSRTFGRCRSSMKARYRGISGRMIRETAAEL
jgi:hypothetical protein